MSDIAQIIASLGFPIAMCGALCFYIWKVQQPLTGAIVKLIDRVDQLLDRLEDTNTAAGAKKTGRKE